MSPGPAPEAVRRVLQERARALARVPDPPDPGETVAVAVFVLGRERYAIDAGHLLAVAALVALAPLPGAPPFFLGLTVHGGEVVAVLDLGRLFGFDRPALSDLTTMVVLGADRPELAVAAEAVLDISSVGRRAFAPPASLTGPGREAIAGVDPDALILLDVDALLSDGRLIIDQPDDRGDGDDHAA